MILHPTTHSLTYSLTSLTHSLTHSLIHIPFILTLLFSFYLLGNMKKLCDEKRKELIERLAEVDDEITDLYISEIEPTGTHCHSPTYLLT